MHDTQQRKYIKDPEIIKFVQFGREDLKSKQFTEEDISYFMTDNQR